MTGQRNYKNNQLSIFLLFAVVIILSGCSNKEAKISNDKINAAVIDEYPIIEIPLPEILDRKIAELSGLTWYGDQLILLPQYPKLMTENNSPQIFGISKDNILTYLKTKNESVLNFYRIEFIEKGLEKYSGEGSGYEAITFIGNTAFLTIEYMNGNRTESLIVKGSFDFENKTLKLDPASLTKINSEDKIFNLSNETILRFGDQIITIYEANGKSITDKPQVSSFNEELNFQKFLSLPNIEYRITDATDADSTGKFWVINYFYPGDNKKLKPADDKVIQKFGIGKSHKQSPAVERLVELQIIDEAIEFSDKEPVYLVLLGDDVGRNWEGIVRLNDIGFLIAADTYPKTILAFVPAEIF